MAENANASVLVSRNQVLSYMNVGTDTEAKWALIGEGFTAFSESKNAQEYERHYVHERSARTDVVGYAPAIEYSTDYYTNNEVIAKVQKVTDKELVGTDAQVEIIHVHMWENSGDAASPKYFAIYRKYAIIPDGKGDGTEALIYTGSMKAVGDIQEGTFNGTAFEKAEAAAAQ